MRFRGAWALQSEPNDALPRKYSSVCRNARPTRPLDNNAAPSAIRNRPNTDGASPRNRNHPSSRATLSRVHTGTLRYHSDFICSLSVEISSTLCKNYPASPRAQVQIEPVAVQNVEIQQVSLLVTLRPHLSISRIADCQAVAGSGVAGGGPAGSRAAACPASGPTG